MLKEAGANLQKPLLEQGGVNILYMAAQFGHDIIVSYLLDNKIIKNPNQEFNRNEKTALQVATKNGHFNVASILIEKSQVVASSITIQRT